MELSLLTFACWTLIYLCNGLNTHDVIKHSAWYSPLICLYMCVIDS
jgi:hypothetical protein